MRNYTDVSVSLFWSQFPKGRLFKLRQCGLEVTTVMNGLASANLANTPLLQSLTLSLNLV